ncbi:MAG: DMT family transporter [Hyphomicrobiales bacterium]|nr:DMT family transporter [Hyphomicrobiales bacterium]
MPVAGLKAKGGGKCYSAVPLARSIQTKTAPMTSVSAPTNATSRSLEGIACVVIGMLLFVGQDGMMKFMLEIFPIWTLMAVRGLIALVVLTSLILWLGKPHRLFTPLWRLHVLRGLLLGFGFSLFYAAFPFMNLAEVSTIFFSAPLMIGVLSVVMLGETIGKHRTAALVIGFAGVLIAMNPQIDNFRWATVLPLVCAFSYALAQILARRIGERETTLTTGLYTLVFSSLAVLPAGWLLNQVVDIGPDMVHLGWHFPALDGQLVLFLILVGINGSIGFLLLSRAYQVANASLVAPFDYTYLPFATLMAYFVWSEVPSTNTLIGMALIIACGLYLGYREIRNAQSQDDPLPVAETFVAPGNPMGTPDLDWDDH